MEMKGRSEDNRNKIILYIGRQKKGKRETDNILY